MGEVPHEVKRTLGVQPERSVSKTIPNKEKGPTWTA
jgi:hypothetical protein